MEDSVESKVSEKWQGGSGVARPLLRNLALRNLASPILSPSMNHATLEGWNEIELEENERKMLPCCFIAAKMLADGIAAMKVKAIRETYEIEQYKMD